MSNAPSVELHDLILDLLKADAAVGEIYGDRIYDRPPADVVWPYVSLGATDSTPEPFEADCLRLIEETITVHLWHDDDGRSWILKNGVHAVRRVLDGARATLPTHALCTMSVGLSRTFPLPDPTQMKGVVQVTAVLQDNGGG